MAAPEPEIDLQDPEQLAALLNATFPEEVTSADQIADQIGTLIESENPAFAHVVAAPTGLGGEGSDVTGAPVGEDLDDPGATAGDGLDDPTGATAGEGPDDTGATAGDGPDGGDSADDVLPPDVNELAKSSPIRSGNKLWTDWLRRAARTKYTLYSLEAKHVRREPIESAFTGKCQSVRVSLPATPVDRDAYIGTFIGKVEAGDHLLFSIEAVRDFYERTFGPAPKIERVDLITGARHLGRRFSPVSIYLAFSDADQPDKPCFFILEGGSASGQPKALYGAKDMTVIIHQKAGFSFTPLTCSNNWYKGGVEMKPDMLHPARVFLTSAQERDGSFDYLDLSVRYKVNKDPRRVIAPFELQVEAALRVLAIAKQMGCKLEQGSGGGLQPVLGPIAEAALAWDTRPRGSANPAERKRYCGCPKPGATAVDPTPPTPERPPARSSTRPSEASPPARKPKPPT